MPTRKEFRVSLPHKTGKLALVCDALSHRGVNIRTIAGIAAAAPVIAIVTEQDAQTRKVLQELDLKFQEVELLSIKLFNKPGEIANLANKLAEAGVNIESIYLSAESKGDEGEISFTVDNPKKAREALGL